jgi:ribosomal protein S6
MLQALRRGKSCAKVSQLMADETVVMENETAEDADVSRVYEAGYQISPNVKEEDVEGLIAEFRAIIEKTGATFIAEGAPVLTKLSFPMYMREGEKNVEYDRGYFGWFKFESSFETANALRETLSKHKSILRAIVFRTVREETRAKIKAPQLREVKRTETAKSAPRKAEESAPVSEADLEKAISDITE